MGGCLLLLFHFALRGSASSSDRKQTGAELLGSVCSFILFYIILLSLVCCRGKCEKAFVQTMRNYHHFIYIYTIYTYTLLSNVLSHSSSLSLVYD